MKIDSMLSRYGKLLEKACRETDSEELVKIARKAGTMKCEIEKELVRLEAGFGEDYAREYFERFDKLVAMMDSSV